MLTWKDALLLRWAINTRPNIVIYKTKEDPDEMHMEPYVPGVTRLHAFFQYLIMASIAFLFMAGCAWAIFVTNANIFILIVCVPVGGAASLFWLAYGFLLVSEIVLGSR